MRWVAWAALLPVAVALDAVSVATGRPAARPNEEWAVETWAKAPGCRRQMTDNPKNRREVMPTKNEPMAVVIARAIYEQPTVNGTPSREFDSLPSHHQAAWFADADRVIGALRKSMAYGFQEFAYEMGGADWLAVTPRELWNDFFASALTEAADRLVELDAKTGQMNEGEK